VYAFVNRISWLLMYSFNSQLFILFHSSVYCFTPIPCCFHYDSFVLCFEVK
jgi:hypothetical protein